MDMPQGRELCLVILESHTKDGRVCFEYHAIQHGVLQLCGRGKPLQALDVEQALEELNELREQCQQQEQGQLRERPFEALEQLAERVFGTIAPIEGLSAMLQRMHCVQRAQSALVPQLTLSVPGCLARRVPWEMWKLECLQCSVCGLYHAARQELGTEDGCLACKQPLLEKRVALFDCAELSHVPAAELLSAAAAAQRDKLVIVVGALSEAETEALQPHIAYVDRRARALFGLGAVEIRERSQATVKNIKALLREPDVRGLYYFGHADDKGLKLHGDQYLTVDAVLQAQPAIPFVFLNACYAAASDLAETKLALAFAGPGKLVVAPTTEVMASHAAEFAESFFLALYSQACSPSEALSYAYRSLTRNQISSISGVYRRFGRLHGTFVPARTVKPVGLFSRPVKGVLDPERFSFDIGGVLGYAQQTPGETRIGARQLFAGLLRKGQLTRHLVRGLVLDPDRLLSELPALRGPGTRAEKPVRFGRETLGEAVQKVLQEAFQDAALRGEDKVSERDVLARVLQVSELVQARFWPRDMSRADLLMGLQDNYDSLSVNGDGGLYLGDLSPAALRVLHRVIAQLKRLQEANQTLEVDEDAIWLWSFLNEPGACAHEYCRECGIERNIVLDLLRGELRLPEGSDASQPPEHTNEAYSAMAQVIVPMLRAARADAHRQISEHHLLAVYCKRANGSANRTLAGRLVREAELSLKEFSCKCVGPKSTLTDLPDELRRCLSVCTNHARAALLRFWTLAQELNSCSNRVILAAFLDQEDEVTTGELNSRATHATRRALSEYLAERSRLPDLGHALDKHTLSQVIRRLVEGAGKPGAEELDARRLFAEFVSQCPRSFRVALRQLPRYEWRRAVAYLL
jgi:hypothetical protein